MKTTSFFFFFFLLTSLALAGADCGGVEPDGSTDTSVVTDDASTGSDAGVESDSGAGDDASTEADATEADAGDPCADYRWLEGEEWECDTGIQFNCIWIVAVIEGECRIACPDHFGAAVQELEITQTELVYDFNGSYTYICNPSPSSQP